MELITYLIALLSAQEKKQR